MGSGSSSHGSSAAAAAEMFHLRLHQSTACNSACRAQQQQRRPLAGPHERRRAHLRRGNLGSRARTRVLGRWKTTLYRGLRSFLNWLFLTALAALAALLLSAAGGGGAGAAAVGRAPSLRALAAALLQAGPGRPDRRLGQAGSLQARPRIRERAGVRRGGLSPLIAARWRCCARPPLQHAPPGPGAPRSPHAPCILLPASCRRAPAGAMVLPRRHAGRKEAGGAARASIGAWDRGARLASGRPGAASHDAWALNWRTDQRSSIRDRAPALAAAPERRRLPPSTARSALLLPPCAPARLTLTPGRTVLRAGSPRRRP